MKINKPIKFYNKSITKYYQGLKEVNFEDIKTHIFWSKRKYDRYYNGIYYENSLGVWWKREYDSDGNVIYFENYLGYWEKREFNYNCKMIYSENSEGIIIDIK